MTSTYDTFSALLDAIEDDETLQAFVQEHYKCQLTRGKLQVSLSKREHVERLTWLYMEPEDWAKQVYNSPVHVYTWLTGQEAGDPHGYRIDLTDTFQIAIRVDPSRSLEDIYNLVDQIQEALRRHDADVRPLWNNQSVEFETILNEWPLIMISASIEQTLCTED